MTTTISGMVKVDLTLTYSTPDSGLTFTHNTLACHSVIWIGENDAKMLSLGSAKGLAKV